MNLTTAVEGKEYIIKDIVTDDDDYLYVDTNDVWDDGDMVGINILPEDIRIKA